MNPDPSGQSRRPWWQRLLSRLRHEPETRDDLLDRLRCAQAAGVIDGETLAMIEGALSISALRVRDIMIPSAQMDVVPREATLAETLEIVGESAHSRYPVVGESRDEVVGVLIAKDLLRCFSGGTDGQGFNLQDILRPALFVPESKRLDALLGEFRAGRSHMAVVINEYGGAAGLVTIEDVLEEIVGDIEDEHDFGDEPAHILRYPGGRFIVKALTPIDEFNDFFATSYDEDEFDTFGGVVVKRFGRIPVRGDAIVFDGLAVRVLRADARRVHLFEVRQAPAAEAGA